MIFKEFYDKLYYGCDIVMFYNGFYYFLNSAGEFKDDEFIEHEISLYISTERENITGEEIYKKSLPSREENIEHFLTSKIFDNRNFYDIQNEVEIIYS